MYLKIDGSGADALKKALSLLKDRRVLIGIPQASDQARGQITNVELAFIMTNGSPKHGIPPRPFLEPALEDKDTQDKIAREMGKGFQAAINGNAAGITEALSSAGMVGQNAVKSKIASSVPPPNKPETVKRKGSAVTLIDTGNLQGAITYVVE